MKLHKVQKRNRTKKIKLSIYYFLVTIIYKSLKRTITRPKYGTIIIKQIKHVVKRVNKVTIKTYNRKNCLNKTKICNVTILYY